uniref:Eukaryotic translation initiation factor 3 subunit K n=1 Tax=Lynceus sp. MCZ IZ 141354 TaxID=1930659 RepID=A0A9N6WTC7_9CRUS|nr:EOG090X0BWZ [Lynceus sp. MCZ IZ 141354]
MDPAGDSKTTASMVDAYRPKITAMLKGIERYNPENLRTLESFVGLQASGNIYELEANLAVLRLYQFSPHHYNNDIAALILLKAFTNLPHTDFVLCKCLLSPEHYDDVKIAKVMVLANFLETCNFKDFWAQLKFDQDLVSSIVGFEDSIRKFVCHVVSITYQTIEFNVLKELLGNVPDAVVKQWISKNGWKEEQSLVFVASQEDMVKTKNITEKIEFENVANIMASCT